MLKAAHLCRGSFLGAPRRHCFLLGHRSISLKYAHESIVTRNLLAKSPPVVQLSVEAAHQKHVKLQASGGCIAAHPCSKQQVIVLTGPTAVGKTNASLALAEKVGGEIISADSVQVYTGLDVGSDKVGITFPSSWHVDTTYCADHVPTSFPDS